MTLKVLLINLMNVNSFSAKSEHTFKSYFNDFIQL